MGGHSEEEVQAPSSPPPSSAHLPLRGLIALKYALLAFLPLPLLSFLCLPPPPLLLPPPPPFLTPPLPCLCPVFLPLPNTFPLCPSAPPCLLPHALRTPPSLLLPPLLCPSTSTTTRTTSRKIETLIACKQKLQKYSKAKREHKFVGWPWQALPCTGRQGPGSTLSPVPGFATPSTTAPRPSLAAQY